MYINAGQGNVIDLDDVIGIFDLDITSQSYITREFLKNAEKAGSVVNLAEDIPKTFAVSCSGNERKVYLIQPSLATLSKRAESSTL